MKKETEQVEESAGEQSELFEQLMNERIEIVRALEVKLSEIVPPDDGLMPSREFIESVRHYGILDPLLLVRIGKKYHIKAGRRRYLAAREVGLETVPASRIKSSDLTSDLISITSNRLRSENLISDVRVIKRMLKEGLSEKEIRSLTGLKHQEVKRRLSIAMADPRVFDNLENNRCTFATAEAVSKLSPTRQKDLLDRFDEEMSQDGEAKLTMTLVKDEKVAVQQASAEQAPRELFETPSLEQVLSLPPTNGHKPIDPQLFKLLVDALEGLEKAGLLKGRSKPLTAARAALEQARAVIQ